MASSSTRPKSSTGACAPTARGQVLDHSCDRSPIHPPPERNVVSESESPVIPAPEPKSHPPLTIRDWWTDQIDVSTLHPHSAQANPLGDDFDYAAEFAKLDVDALKADVISVMTTSQDWWPADYVHYRRLFIRMSRHPART